jgi:hypothetical protein
VADLAEHLARYNCALRTVDVRPISIADPVHRDAIGPWLAAAVAELLVESPYGRSISDDVYSVRGDVELRAWHIFWAITADPSAHDLGDEDASTLPVDYVTFGGKKARGV